jgi:putative addiction module killer protein
VYRIRQTAVFAKWLAGLRDNRGKALILTRITTCQLGNLGDSRSVGGGVHELRIHFGPGYRVYFAKRRNEILLLLCGGNKSGQARDIERAKQLLTAATGAKEL